MIPIQCPRCGHIQDVRFAFEDWFESRCELCGYYFSFVRRHLWGMATLSLTMTLWAWYLGMPTIFIAICAVVTAITALEAALFSSPKNARQNQSARNQPKLANSNSSAQIPLIYTPRELATDLPVVDGRKIHITYPRGAEGPQTATRLVSGEFSKHGARLVTSSEEAEVSIDVHVKHDGRFRFSVSDPSNQKPRRQIECGPRELTAAILTAVCEFFRQSDAGEPDPKKAERQAQLLQALDQAANQDVREVQKTLSCRREELIDALLDSANDLNRKITGALMVMDFQSAGSYMEQLARRITALGQLGDERGIGTILDALGDAAGFYQSTCFPIAQVLRDAAIEALAAIGAPAIEPLKERLPYTDSFPALKHSLETVYERLKREYS